MWAGIITEWINEQKEELCLEKLFVAMGGGAKRMLRNLERQRHP